MPTDMGFVCVLAIFQAPPHVPGLSLPMCLPWFPAGRTYSPRSGSRSAWVNCQPVVIFSDTWGAVPLGCLRPSGA